MRKIYSYSYSLQGTIAPPFKILLSSQVNNIPHTHKIRVGLKHPLKNVSTWGPLLKPLGKILNVPGAYPEILLVWPSCPLRPPLPFEPAPSQGIEPGF